MEGNVSFFFYKATQKKSERERILYIDCIIYVWDNLMSVLVLMKEANAPGWKGIWGTKTIGSRFPFKCFPNLIPKKIK